MPWCPKCKAEYREGFTECAACHVALVDELPAGDKHASVQAEPEVLYTVTGSLDAEILCELLRREGIAAYAREQTLGQGARLYTGASYFGTDILIDREDREHACEVLANYLALPKVPVEEEELAQQALQGTAREETAQQAERAKTSAREKGHIRVFRGLLAADQLLVLLLALLAGVLAIVQFARNY